MTENPRLNTCRAIVKRSRDDRVTEESHCNSEANEPSVDHVTLGQKKGTPKDIQGLLRHSLLATTTVVYMQEIPESVKATIEAINRELRKPS